MRTGADVTHPMGGEDLPSVAAVVGSVDATAAKYAARVSMQTGGCMGGFGRCDARIGDLAAQG